MDSCRNKLVIMSAAKRLPKSWPWTESIKSFCFALGGNDVRRRDRFIAVSGQEKPPTNGRSEKPDRKERAARMASGFAYCAIGFLALACYSNCLHSDFVHDDIMAIVKNPDVKTESSILELWTHDFWGQKMSSNLSHKSYRPLTILTFRFNFYFGGLNPIGYHVTNVLLHALATVLFMYLCGHVVELDSRMSSLAAAMFAVHPIHTEAVAGIVGRADVLSCIFFLISIIFYVRSGSETGMKNTTQMLLLLGSLLSAACATLSKETGCSAYLVCLAYDLTLLLKLERRKKASDRRGIVLRLTATIATLFGVLFFRWWIMHWSLPVFTVDDNPASFHPQWSVRLMSYLHIASLGIWLTVNPSTLSYDWTMGSVPLVRSLTDVRNLSTILISTATFAGATLIVFNNNKNVNKRPFIFGYMMMVFSYLPTTNLFYRVGFVIAERLLYTSSCGYIVLLVASLERIHLRMPRCRLIIYACVAMLMTSHAARTLIRNQVWIDRESLFRSGVQSQLNNGKLYYNYGNLMRDRGQVVQAASFYREAIRLWPTYASAKNNLGTIVSDDAEAEVLYRQALADQPCHSNALFNLGNLLSHRGEYDRAIVDLWGAAQCDPESSLPHSSLAAIHRHLRNTQLAEWHYLKAIQLTPNKANVYYNYASFLRERGRDSSALHYCGVLSEVNGRQHRWNLESCEGKESSCKTFSSHSLDQQFHRDDVMLEQQLISVTRVCENLETLDNSRLRLSMNTFEKRLSSSHHKTPDQHDRSKVVGLSETEIKLMTIKQRSDALGSSGHHKKATVFLEQCFERNILADHKVLGFVHYELARHLQDSGREEAAFMHYLKAIENNPILSDANHRVAIFYHLKGCVDKAKQFYIRALHLEPQNKLVAENLGKLIRTQKTVESRNIVSHGTSQDFNKMASDKQNGGRDVKRSNLSSFSKNEGIRNRQDDHIRNEYTISNTKQISRDAGAITKTVVFQ